MKSMSNVQMTDYSDLENDNINPYDFGTCSQHDHDVVASRLNKYVLPEYISHAAICLILLFNGDWIFVMLMLPLVAYHVKT